MFEETSLSTRSGTLTITQKGTASNISDNGVDTNGSVFLDFGFGVQTDGSTLDLNYGVNYGSWTFVYSIKILNKTI